MTMAGCKSMSAAGCLSGLVGLKFGCQAPEGAQENLE